MNKDAQKTPEQEMHILHPNQSVMIDGAEITVQEYTLVQGMKVIQQARVFIDALGDSLLNDDEQVSMVQLEEVFADNFVVVAELVAMSINKTSEYVQNLKEADGSSLLMTWWMVNRGFFVRRLLQRLPTLVVAAAQGISTKH